MDDVVLDDLSQSNDGISDDDDCIEVGFSYTLQQGCGSGALEAQNRVAEGRGRSQWRRGGLKLGPLRAMRPVFADSHRFDEEQDSDPSKKLDPDLR